MSAPKFRYIEIERSDGDINTWPTISGDNDQFEGVDNQSNHSVRWRSHIGRALAITLKFPVGPEYILKDWPNGYGLFIRYRSVRNVRKTDLYLYGIPFRPFRSPNEFIPHAIWLFQNTDLKASDCLCKHCTGRSQMDVSRSLPSILLPQPVVQPSVSLQDGESQTPGCKFYAAVHRLPAPFGSKGLSTFNGHAKPAALDLNAGILVQPGFREGDLVWCVVYPPIKSKGPNSSTTIRFWPGIVEEIGDHTNISYRIRSSNTETDDSTDLSMDEDRPSTFGIRLLGITNLSAVTGNQILPYQAYSPSANLITELDLCLNAVPNEIYKNISIIDPCLDESMASFPDAAPLYASALGTASAISNSWCLTDEWTSTYISPTIDPTDISLDLGRANQCFPRAAFIIPQSRSRKTPEWQHDPGASRSHSTHGDIVTDIPEVPTSRPQELTVGVPRQQASNSPLHKRQTRVQFRGMWWGAERILTGDFIRIILPRRSIAPKGSPNVFPPSGPGKSVLNEHIAKTVDVALLGAGSRGVFMRLDNLHAVDVVVDGKHTKECRAGGMLYELADVDWEGDEEVTSKRLKEDSRSMDHSTESSVQFHRNNTLPISKRSEFSLSCTTQESLNRYLPPLPPAQPGYRFRKILPDGYEAVLSLCLISGKYYPNILSSSLLGVAYEDTRSSSLDVGGLHGDYNPWALCGLADCRSDFVDPSKYKSSREKMLKDAERLPFSLDCFPLSGYKNEDRMMTS